ncbi:MAG: SDR family NAD(P)-dependent oxidoreductase [Vicinamibacterales bacterium]
MIGPASRPTRRMLARRDLLASGAALLAGGSCRGPRETVPAARPGTVPVGPFGRHSTAEDVTAGLDLTGRRILVTGATSGLGLETVRVLATRGADVIVTGRTRNRAVAACRGLTPGRTTPLALELEDWAGIRSAADEVTRGGRPLDVLICNAGIMAPRTLRLVHGVEQQFAVNHLAHFILCLHLLPALRAAAQGRIVVVSSSAIYRAPPCGVDFANLDAAKGYEPFAMYGQSKFANALFAFALARRLAGSRVTANALHPGVVNTNLDRAESPLRRLRARLMAWNNPRLKSVGAGAATQVYLASAPALATVSGRFFEDCNPIVLDDPRFSDPALMERLWAASEALTRSYLPTS